MELILGCLHYTTKFTGTKALGRCKKKAKWGENASTDADIETRKGKKEILEHSTEGGLKVCFVFKKGVGTSWAALGGG